MKVWPSMSWLFLCVHHHNRLKNICHGNMYIIMWIVVDPFNFMLVYCSFIIFSFYSFLWIIVDACFKAFHFFFFQISLFLFISWCALFLFFSSFRFLPLQQKCYQLCALNGMMPIGTWTTWGALDTTRQITVDDMYLHCDFRHRIVNSTNLDEIPNIAHGDINGSE